MKTIKYLSILLSISLGANMWFAWRWYQQETSPAAQSTRTQNHSATESTNLTRHAWQEHSTDLAEKANNLDNDTLIDKTSQQSYKRYLHRLVMEKDFDTLEYEVGLYLRKYPRDIDAMLLEAQAYYHTKPLNIALVHYQELLSQALNKEQQDEVEKIILVNTTRVIQQFSGDGAWDLLAAFIEPLVQVDPLNRQYLMALARAYGMQRQLTLMEDTLANFLPTDARANRLRENVLARLDNKPIPNQALEEIAGKPVRLAQRQSADVLLHRSSQGHFIADVRVRNTAARMLVDTGASTTAISDIKFSSIPSEEIEFLGLFTVNTAGGAIQAPIYKVKQLRIGQQSLENISVLVLPGENLSSFDGLLGMNVLKQFDMIFDANSKTMELYKKDLTSQTIN